jgi:cyclopropane fatty-acyl-phospholipid synthase-like methyltransferase
MLRGGHMIGGLRLLLGFGVPAKEFEKLYAGGRDPWNYVSSAYEAQKYAFTLNSLSRNHYSSALEIGCSIGVMTKQLAPRCDTLLAIDVSESALRQAKQRCSEAHVEFALMRVPKDWPKGRFDLIMMSEVLYYLSAADFDALIERLKHAVALDGEIILVHHWAAGGWRKRTWFDVANRRHDRLIALLRDFTQVTQHEDTEDYRFDRLQRV